MTPKTTPIIFISHITPEASIAHLLKDLLLRAFGETITVFVSSDCASIETGARPFPTIIAALSRAAVVIVLLSEASLERRWINFEAGIAYAHGQMSQNTRLLPLAVRSQQPNVGPPLSELQVRQLRDPHVVTSMLRDIASHLGLTARRIRPARFLEQFDATEQSLQRADLHLAPVIVWDSQGSPHIIFDLQNPTTAVACCERLWAAIPTSMLRQEQGRFSHGGLREETREIDGQWYVVKELRPTDSVPSLPAGWPPPTILPVYLRPRESRVVKDLAFFLREVRGSIPREFVLLHQAFGPQHSTTCLRTVIADIGHDFER
jgi:hypothetical protein